MSAVSLITLADGALGMVEPERAKGLDRRVFRQCDGGYEWSHLADIEENGSRARWYHYAPRELPESMIAR